MIGYMGAIGLNAYTVLSAVDKVSGSISNLMQMQELGKKDKLDLRALERRL